VGLGLIGLIGLIGAIVAAVIFPRFAIIL